MEEKKVDIVLVGYRSEKFLPRLLEDIRDMTLLPHEVHYLDNSRNEKTLSQAWNDLAAQGTAHYIAIMNPDIALSPGWDNRLAVALETGRRVGIATPDPFGSSPTAEAMPSREEMARKAHERAAVLEHTTKEVQFFLAMMRRTSFSVLRGFDERMRFYMQDSDAIKRMEERLDLRTVRVHACPVWHQGSASTAAAIEHKELDQKVEYDHSFAVWREVREGRWKPWDRLADHERRAVREDPRFAKMGVNSTGHM